MSKAIESGLRLLVVISLVATLRLFQQHDAKADAMQTSYLYAAEWLGPLSMVVGNVVVHACPSGRRRCRPRHCRKFFGGSGAALCIDAAKSQIQLPAQSLSSAPQHLSAQLSSSSLEDTAQCDMRGNLK